MKKSCCMKLLRGTKPLKLFLPEKSEGLGLGTHLFVKAPRPGDSGSSDLFGLRVKLLPVINSLTTH